MAGRCVELPHPHGLARLPALLPRRLVTLARTLLPSVLHLSLAAKSADERAREPGARHVEDEDGHDGAPYALQPAPCLGFVARLPVIWPLAWSTSMTFAGPNRPDASLVDAGLRASSRSDAR